MALDGEPSSRNSMKTRSGAWQNILMDEFIGISNLPQRNLKNNCRTFARYVILPGGKKTLDRRLCVVGNFIGTLRRISCNIGMLHCNGAERWIIWAMRLRLMFS
jgi:uncharacterized membrane protein YecN with MAPEG domain